MIIFTPAMRKTGDIDGRLCHNSKYTPLKMKVMAQAYSSVNYYDVVMTTICVHIAVNFIISNSVRFTGI